jgi:hypothetical protein
MESLLKLETKYCNYSGSGIGMRKVISRCGGTARFEREKD